MQYQKIPFARRNPLARARNPVLAGLPFVDPIGLQQRGVLEGLAPIVARAPAATSTYAPNYPGGGFLGAVPTSPTVIMRPQPNSPPGFPGFFGWLKTEHPDFYNYAVVALPQYVTMTEGKRTGGATLAGLMGLGDDVDSLDTVDLSDISSTAAIDPGSLATVSVSDTNVPNSTPSGTPAPSASVASQIVSTLTQAAPAILSTVNQQQVFQTQLARAAAGLPPLNTSAYGLTGSGTTGISSGALLALLGVGAIVLVMAGKKG